MMQPIFTALGFWRMEWTGTDGKHKVAVGVLPTPNSTIRSTVRYVALYANGSTPSKEITCGIIADVAPSASSDLASLAGRIRIPATSITTHLDAPSLVDQGMIASTLIGQSFAMNGNGDSPYYDANLDQVIAGIRRPFYQWAGPALGTTANMSSIVQIMANDPTRFVEKPLKDDTQNTYQRMP